MSYPSYPSDPAGPPLAYPYSPRPSHPGGLATAALVVAGSLTVMQIGLGVSVWSAAGSYERAADEGRSALDVITAYDVIGLLMFPLMLGAYVVTCLWLRRCRANTVILAPGSTYRRSAIWVWLGWWVPVVSLWFPLQIVGDVQRISTDDRPRSGLGLWWAGWLVWALCNRITGRMSSSAAADGSGASALPVIEVVATIALVVAFVCWLRIVREITGAQAARLAA